MDDNAFPTRNGEKSAARKCAQTGMHVLLELLDETGASELLEVDIVPDSHADFAHGFLGEGTPLARAIWEQPAGKVLPYRQADIVAVRILDVTPSGAANVADTARERE